MVTFVKYEVSVAKNELFLFVVFHYMRLPKIDSIELCKNRKHFIDQGNTYFKNENKLRHQIIKKAENEKLLIY